MTDPSATADALSGSDGTQPPEPFPLLADPLAFGDAGTPALAPMVLPPLPAGPDPEEMRRAIAAALADDELDASAEAAQQPTAARRRPTPHQGHTGVFPHPQPPPNQGWQSRLPTNFRPPMAGPTQAWEQMQRHVQVRRQVARAPVAQAPPQHYQLAPYQRPQRAKQKKTGGAGCIVGAVILMIVFVSVLVSIIDAVGR